MFFIDHDHMIETFAANRADEALNVWILPRRTRCGEDFFDLHACDWEQYLFLTVGRAG